MRILGLFLAIGLGAAALTVGCKASPPNEQAPEVKLVEAAAEIQPSAEDGEDGACKGRVCVARCDKLGRQRDCLKAGEACRMGLDDVMGSPSTAVKYLEKACEKRDREGCFRLGHLLAAGDKGVARDVAKAVPLLTTACDLGRGQACDELASCAERGEGMARDHGKAIALLARGCAADDFQSWTCSALKKAFDARDPEAVKAVEAWKKACAAKEKAACNRLEHADVK